MIRYPGSKDKIAKAIIRHFPDQARMGGLFGQDNIEYVEPFVGGGAVAFKILSTLRPKHSVWLNDRDYGIACLWKSVYQSPDELCEKVRRFTPSVEAFYRYREEDGRKDADVVELGFRKLALHQISFSGLGAKAGGPLGGREQSSEYNVDCRWNAIRLCREVQQRHKGLRRHRSVKITSKDFADVIGSVGPSAFIYADPPYVEKGGQLYAHSMSEADHRRLEVSLRRCRAPFVLSYDDHPLVRELYSWARIESVSLTYTTAIAGATRRKNSEIIISPNPLVTPRPVAAGSDAAFCAASS